MDGKPIKPTGSKRKIVESAVGAALGAAIAGPAGALVGGLAASQAESRVERLGHEATAPDADDPIIHAQPRRILVPLDFSPPSLRALRFAREWAGRFGADVCLLHVIEPMHASAAFSPMPFAPPMPDLRDRMSAELEGLARHEFPATTQTSVLLRDGAPHDQIAAVAREMDADLIIIATHGRTGLKHALIGSTAERVVREAPCPVLTLRRSARHSFAS